MSAAIDLTVVPTQIDQLGSDLALAPRAITTITTVEACQLAVDERKTLGAQIKRVRAYFEPLKEQAFRLHRAITTRENDVLKPMQTLDVALRTEIQRFNDERERQRRADEQRLAEQQRRDEQDRLTREAAALELSGEGVLAAAVVEQAITAPPPVVQLPTVKQQVVGLKTRTVYRWRYSVSKEQTLKVIPRNYLTIDEKALDGAARSAPSIPGIQFYSEEVPTR